MNNFIIAVVSCEKNLKTRIPIIKQYAYKNVNYVIVTGSCAKLFDNQLCLDVDDSYFNLRLKTIKLLEWFVSTSYDFIVKADDDAYVDVNEIYKLVNCDYTGCFIPFKRSDEAKTHHINYIQNKCGIKHTFDYFDTIKYDFKYAAGGCYILSKESANRILNYINNHTIPNIIQEDITIGYISNKLGIPYIDSSIAEPWYDINRFSIHPCSTVLMKSLNAVENIEDKINLCRKLLMFSTYYTNYHRLNITRGD